MLTPRRHPARVSLHDKCGPSHVGSLYCFQWVIIQDATDVGVRKGFMETTMPGQNLEK